jgi:hypothetical protein
MAWLETRTHLDGHLEHRVLDEGPVARRHRRVERRHVAHGLQHGEGLGQAVLAQQLLAEILYAQQHTAHFGAPSARRRWRAAAAGGVGKGCWRLVTVVTARPIIFFSAPSTREERSECFSFVSLPIAVPPDGVGGARPGSGGKVALCRSARSHLSRSEESSAQRT